MLHSRRYPAEAVRGPVLCDNPDDDPAQLGAHPQPANVFDELAPVGAMVVPVEFVGAHHRTDRRQYVKDIRRLEMLEQLGWVIVRVVAEDRPADIVRRVRAALAKSGVAPRLSV